jgi:hypothetical protein
MCSEDAYERRQTVFSTLVTAALALAKLLDAIFQFLSLNFGCLFVEVVTCKEFVY